MKKILRKFLPQKVKEILKKNFYKKFINNYFNKNLSKRALLSYIITPFIEGVKYTHTNTFAAITWAKVLDEQGYQVDIIDFNYIPKELKLSQYDLLCGFGEAFEKFIFTTHAKAKTIIYATGMHNCYQNAMTLKRLKDVYEKKNVWLGESVRYVDKFYSSHVSFVDAVVALGNDVCANSYKLYNENVYSLSAPFFKVLDFMEIIRMKKDDFQRHFLWFGSKGTIHKGLDLLLDFFAKRRDVYLHVCGNVEKEIEFCKVYEEELFHTPNIYYHGFIDIASEKFEEILIQCGFVIFPSASEGGAPSVLTCIGNGGLIPIITKETAVSTGHEIWIEDFTEKDIENSVERALSLSKNKVIDMMYKNGSTVNNKNSLESYEKNLRNIIKEILTKNN